ncbi:DUF294 nucleotidyltransferase-like domain-containing protein [Sinomicrobium kalidii]|uniref:DUF294 nucleotidyltransferase-like domain-containing protein n=1 Tax=Sinomicrobium kalidii TaxID=2900738 RepID=UPI001E3F8EDA|nr:DUF294 nucleotidyltransferase-like domain-containing protein [Sinomicrobium kalidii]UGU14979.1 DUF294 nucleotidyltransferase-like domain-containing protein [Sinomicrobium kalidii]
MKNTIALRIADFLKNHPPFDVLSKEQLLEVSSHVQVLYFEKNKIIFDDNDEGHNQFYVVHKGAVALQKRKNGDFITIDNCDEGDIFGLRPLIARENYVIKAITREESILYGIPIDVFRPVVEKNLRVGNFLIESFASNTENPYSEEHRRKLYSENGIDIGISSSTDLYDLQPARYVKNVITCNKEDKTRDIALLMRENNIGSVVVTENDIPVGIVTDRDLKNKIVTGDYPIDIPIHNIMTSPVICYPRNITIAQAQTALMKHKIGHLCITKDGTPKSKLIGLISEHDITVSQGNNPSVLMKAIKRASKTKHLKRIHEKIMILLNGYIRQNIPLTHISRIITELNDATIKRCIELSLKKMPESPPVKFAWLSLGSQGRKEQLLHTDQDNAIVFENVPAEILDKTRAYFITLAQKVTKRLNTLGYEYCPADMMASNPKWCLSLDEWKEQFTKWIAEPGENEILLCSIFFDFDISYGDSTLTDALGSHIFEKTGQNTYFSAMLAKSVLQNPSPLGFFRQFLVEQNGEYKDFFDLKKRAITPITDAGRVLILSHQVRHINNTAERFEKLAELEPENKQLYLSCSYTSKALLKFRTKHGLMHNDSGRYIELAALSKEERMKLKRCFKTIREIQELIKMRYKLTSFI